MSSDPASGDWSIYYAYAALGVQAVIPIVTGSFASVRTPRTSSDRARKSSKEVILDPDETDDEDEDEAEERIGLTDSLMFPVVASVTLFSLFLVFKYLDSKWINQILGGYFALASVLAFQFTFTYLLKGVWTRLSSRPHTKYHFRIEKGYKQLVHVPLTAISLVVIPFSVILPIIYIFLEKPWYITNILSFSFAVSSISVLKLDGFKAGGALLTGLFFYDIFWVFGTPVMVSVAKNLDAPIKVLAPRNIHDADAGFSMLGLGDIVIPGIFISLALRYDFASYVRRTLKRNPDAAPTKEDSYNKPYFWTVLVAYVAGLTTTVVVMHTFKAAQPALLYLSPACIGAVTVVGAVRGELKQLWRWDGDEDNSAEQDEKLSWSTACAMDETPVKSELVHTQADRDPQSAENGDVTPVDEDEEWMNLNNPSSEEGTKNRKKKANKKKK